MHIGNLLFNYHKFNLNYVVIFLPPTRIELVGSCCSRQTFHVDKKLFRLFFWFFLLFSSSSYSMCSLYRQPNPCSLCRYAVNNDNLLLRGCILRNTKWCCALVVFAGADTKLMKNSGVSTFKRTHVDKYLNRIILMVRLYRHEKESMFISIWIASFYWCTRVKDNHHRQ